MRIDDRKVNGQITIEPEDTVDGLKILLDTTGPKWVAGFNPDGSPIYARNAAVADKLNAALATLQPLHFIVMTINLLDAKGTVYPERAYDIALNRDTITIDVNDIKVGKKLKITVLTGAIELVDNK